MTRIYTPLDPQLPPDFSSIKKYDEFNSIDFLWKNDLLRMLEDTFRKLRKDIDNINNKLNLDDVMWDDLRVPAQNTKLNPTKSEPAFEEFTDGLYVYKFDDDNADDESVHFIAQIPHSYKEGTDIYPHIHWSPDTTDTGNVRWQFEYVISNYNEAFSDIASSETITTAASGTVLQHQKAYFTAISNASLKISSIIICRLTRLGYSDAADTFTGNACFLEFDFHYQKDTIGSIEELSKTVTL